MALAVASGATLSCTFGAAPSTLTVLVPQAMGKTPLATITDFAPMVNIAPFGMCSSPANPLVAAATAAALGVLTPQPCVPLPVGPWAPGSPTVLIGGKPALRNLDRLLCAYGGVIQVTSPANTNIQVK